MMIIENKFNIKEVVYLRTDTDQKPRIVTALIVKENEVIYELGSGTESTWHKDFEISKEKDVLICTDN